MVDEQGNWKDRKQKLISGSSAYLQNISNDIKTAIGKKKKNQLVV